MGLHALKLLKNNLIKVCHIEVMPGVLICDSERWVPRNNLQSIKVCEPCFFLSRSVSSQVDSMKKSCIFVTYMLRLLHGVDD